MHMHNFNVFLQHTNSWCWLHKHSCILKVLTRAVILTNNLNAMDMSVRAFFIHDLLFWLHSLFQYVTKTVAIFQMCVFGYQVWTHVWYAYMLVVMYTYTAYWYVTHDIYSQDLRAGLEHRASSVRRGQEVRSLLLRNIDYWKRPWCF